MIKNPINLTDILLKILLQGASSTSRIVLLSCVHSHQTRLADTLPALKFVSRIRECICAEMQKRKIPSFDLGEEKKEDNVLEALKEEINDLSEHRKGKMTKEEIELLVDEKEKEVKALLAKTEEEMNRGEGRTEESGLIEKYEELLLLKNKIGQMRKEQLALSQAKLSPIAQSPYPTRKIPPLESPINDRRSEPERRGAASLRSPGKMGHEIFPQSEKGLAEERDKEEDVVERNAKLEEELKESNEINSQKIRELETQIYQLQSNAKSSHADLDTIK